jgi:hypothetical protein
VNECAVFRRKWGVAGCWHYVTEVAFTPKSFCISGVCISGTVEHLVAQVHGDSISTFRCVIAYYKLRENVVTHNVV